MVSQARKDSGNCSIRIDAGEADNAFLATKDYADLSLNSMAAVTVDSRGNMWPWWELKPCLERMAVVIC